MRSPLLLSLFIICGCLHSAALHANEKILLPGYVRSNNTNQITSIAIAPSILPGWSQAGQGFVPQPTPAGLRLIVDNSWPDWNNGYRPVTLEFLVLKPSATERNLRAELEFGANRRNPEFQVPIEAIVIPANATTWKHRIVIPSGGNSTLSSIKVWEDDRPIPELTIPNFGSNNNNSTNYEFHALALHPHLPNGNLPTNIGAQTSISATSDSQDTTIDRYENNAVYSYPAKVGWSGFQSFDELPDIWQAYTTLQTFCGTRAQLTELRDKHPAQWKAVSTWISNGGHLLVEDDGTDANERAAIANMLSVWFPQGSETTASDWSDTTMFENRNTLAYDGIGNPIVTYDANGNPNVTYDANGDANVITYNSSGQPIASTPLARHVQANQAAETLHSRSWYLGRVSYPERKTKPTDERQALRDALATDKSNARSYSTTQTPSVGEPPLVVYRWAITLFVILIGPVNYFYFKKRKRLTWLLVTVPVGALATTALLLLYALAKDGIAVRAWSDSLTVLDQTRRQAATVRDFHLFAGVAPSGGFALPTDTSVVVPSYGSNRNQYGYGYYYDDSGFKEFKWNDAAASAADSNATAAGKQVFRSGWLESRHLETFHSNVTRPSKRRLEIKPNANGIEIVNRLETDVLRLIVGDESGKFYECDELLVDQSVQKALSATINDWRDVFANVSRKNLINVDATQYDDELRDLLGLPNANPAKGKRMYLAVVRSWPDADFDAEFPRQEPWGANIVVGYW